MSDGLDWGAPVTVKVNDVDDDELKLEWSDDPDDDDENEDENEINKNELIGNKSGTGDGGNFLEKVNIF